MGTKHTNKGRKKSGATSLTAKTGTHLSVPGKREAIIKIRCSPETFWAFKNFVASRRFYDYEDALKYLLREAERLGLSPLKSYL